MTERNFSAEIGTESERLKQWFTKAVTAFKITFGLMVFVALILVIIGVILNRTVAVLNFSLAALFVVIWGFLTFHPAGLLAVFGLGSLNGLPKDWSVNRLIREGALPDLSLSNMAKEGFALIGKWAHYSAHVAYFCIVVFTVLGTWYVRNPVAVLPVLVLLAGIGYWAVLSKVAAKWYYRITFGLLILSLGIFLYRGFIADEGGSNWRAINLPQAASSALPKTSWSLEPTYKKTLDLNFSNLEETTLCGIKPGMRKYSFPQEVLLNQALVDRRLAIKDHPNYHIIEFDGQISRYNMADHVRVNGTVPGERFEVAADGCVKVTHNHPKEFRKRAVILGNEPGSLPATVALLIQFE